MTDRASRILDTLIGLDPLMDLPRTGWRLRGIVPCESLADHSYFVAVTVMLLVDALREEGVTVDGEKALRMALVHDAPEAKTGDVPMPQKTPEMDAALENLERQLVARMLPEKPRADWEEAEAGVSLEARIVKAADKIQMMTKALVYGRQRRGDLAEFWANDKNFRARGVTLAEEIFTELRRRHADPEAWRMGRW
ncbi:MAG: HD family hydrolase [Sandaracinaceae bacterium]